MLEITAIIEVEEVVGTAEVVMGTVVMVAVAGEAAVVAQGRIHIKVVRRVGLYQLNNSGSHCPFILGLGCNGHQLPLAHIPQHVGLAHQAQHVSHSRLAS